MERRHRFPHPLTLLVGCILLAAALSYVLPAGRYERREDPETGRTVVVAGTYRPVPRRPVDPLEAAVAVPRGMAEAGAVIFLVFLIGGAFTVVDRTGVLRRSVRWLVRRLDRRETLAIPLVSLPFLAAGALENMQEEIIALVPVLLILTGRLGFPAITAVSMSAGAAFVGAAFSPINPFQVGIAQKLAELPLLSGALYRVAFLALAAGLWIVATMRWTARHRGPPGEDPDEPFRSPDLAAAARGEGPAGARPRRRDAGGPAPGPGATAPASAPIPSADAFGPRDAVVLTLVLGTFGLLGYGLLRLGWDFDQMSGLFFLMGVAAGIAGGLGVTGTARAYADGFRSMAYAALLIGFARAIFVVLEEGRIVDTIVHGLFAPIAGLPPALSALGMLGAHAAVHVPVPSVSGHAVLTMPVVVPLSDLLGLSRQVAVLAYQFGAGLCDLITPTNGALLAILAAGGVRYEEWFRFAAPLYAALMGLGATAIVVGVAVGLG